MVEEIHKKMEYADELENNDNMRTTSKPGHFPLPCLSSGNRRCMDGSCIASVDLCPEELQLNKSTIVVMLVIGLTVLFCLLILYCYKQRSQRRRQENNNNSQQAIANNEDNISLNMPPPTYEEVVSSNLYPATPVFERTMRTSYGEEPRTPPPNYDAALNILAHSNETYMSSKTQPISPVVRRSISTEFNNAGRSLRSADLDFRRVYSNPDQR